VLYKGEKASNILRSRRSRESHLCQPLNREFGESFVYLVYVWSSLAVLGISPTERFERLVLGAWTGIGIGRRL
jgi:hypothetical protein